ncbi:MAG TPA: phosphotransferase, partial [Patescibacteria group bacterium]|nr:phosphotransferase [Patescibacteria group bacterium]
CRGVLNDNQIKIAPASSDASFRSYHRVASRDNSFIVMDAPPDKEDVAPWLDIHARLRKANVNAPELVAVERSQGFILMFDLGDQSYLSQLNDQTADTLYRDALNTLYAMQTRVDSNGLESYHYGKLVAEMELFPEWFLQRHLGLQPNCAGWDTIEHAFSVLTASALEQPQVFVHRDFHSRNLMRTTLNNPGVIDFQDAVKGPITYDLVSLLRDCYIEWPKERVLAWMQAYRERAAAANLIAHNELRFKRWFDLMGVQRHLKVLGIFCRLWYRDGKPQYLADLPLVLKYTLDVATVNKDLKPFGEWLAKVTANIDLTRPRD